MISETHPQYGEHAGRLEKLAEQRIADGETAIAAIWDNQLPRPEYIAAHDVDELRAAIKANFGHFERRGVVREIASEGYDPGFVSTGVFMTPAQVRTLFRLAGFSMIEATDHGPCQSCRWSARGRERGWAAPCSGCGSGHPKFEPFPASGNGG